MAGSGFKTFAVSEVLTAADTNGYLMQGILVFASSSARTTALGSPTEGQASLLKDSNTFEIYDGSAWVALLDTDTFSVDGSGNYTTTTDMTVGGGSLRLGTTAAAETLNVVGITTTSGAGSNLVVAGGDGTGTNQAGAYLALQPGMGTGNVGSGDIRLQTGPAGASGTTTNSTTTVMTVTADSAVGIGETAPASDLVVRADSAGGRGGEVSIINYAAATVGNEAALNFGLENSTYAADLGNCQIKGYLEATSGASAMVFSNYTGSAHTEHMRITSDGKVGIGTIAPSDKLHVADAVTTVSGTQIWAEGRYGGYGSGISFVSATSSGGTLKEMAKITGDGEAAWNTTASTQDAGLRFFTCLDGTLAEKVRIQGDGDVGIGLVAPTARLHITDAGNATRMDRSGYDSYGWVHSAGSGIQWYNYTDSRTEMYFNGAGDVGIGTTTPQARLSLGAATSPRRLLIYDGGAAPALYAGFAIDTPAGNDFSMYAHSSGVLKFGMMANDGTTFTNWVSFLNSGTSLFGVALGYTSDLDTTASGVHAGPGLCIADRSAKTTAASRWVFYADATDAHFYYGGTTHGAGHKFDWDGAGSGYNVTGTWGTITSSGALKQDVTDAASQVDDIKALRLVNFRFIKDVELQGDDALRHLGVIAEEVEAAGMGGLVDERLGEGGETVKSVKTSVMLVKGLKALQEIIGRVEALESASA